MGLNYLTDKREPLSPFKFVEVKYTFGGNMKLPALLAVLFLLIVGLFAAPAYAQTRVLFGAAGGQDFDNSNVGGTLAIEVPFLKHYELDLQDTFSPIESHVSLGGGRANVTSAGGHIWLTKSFGIVGRAEDSAYNVTKVAKDDDYAVGGFAWRGLVGGAPTRFELAFIQEFNNGINSTGLETPHLQGVDFGFTMRFGCASFFCVRNSEDFIAGAVKEQGNPICDGAYGITGGPNGGPCPRVTGVGGGVTGSVVFEFPRRRATENAAF